MLNRDLPAGFRMAKGHSCLAVKLLSKFRNATRGWFTKATASEVPEAAFRHE